MDFDVRKGRYSHTFICTSPYRIYKFPICMQNWAHWGRDKMAASLQMTFSNAFSSMIIFDWNFSEVCSIDYGWALVEGMAWCRTGDITWSDDGQIQRHICASGLIEFYCVLLFSFLHIIVTNALLFVSVRMLSEYRKTTPANLPLQCQLYLYRVDQVRPQIFLRSMRRLKERQCKCTFYKYLFLFWTSR